MVVCTVDTSAGSLSVDILYIVPLRQLFFESSGTVQLHCKFLFGTCLLGSDKDYTVRSAATVQGRCCRAFQYGHAFNIVRVDAGDTVAEVITSVLSGTSVVTVVQRHTVYYIERLIVAGHLRATADDHSGRTGRTAGSLADNQSRNLSCQRVDDIGFFRFFKLFAFHLTDGITKRFPFPFDTQCGNNYFIDDFAVFFQDDFKIRLSFYLYFF